MGMADFSVNSTHETTSTQSFRSTALPLHTALNVCVMTGPHRCPPSPVNHCWRKRICIYFVCARPRATTFHCFMGSFLRVCFQTLLAFACILLRGIFQCQCNPNTMGATTHHTHHADHAIPWHHAMAWMAYIHQSNHSNQNQSL